MEAERTDVATRVPPSDYIYFGNLFPSEPQYKSGLFHGLSLQKRFDRDIAHDARDRLPFADGCIKGFQSQDVFEHIPYADVPAIFDEIYRCLRVGGLFRLSVPDYRSPLLATRSVYDSEGRILCDLAMGGAVESGLNKGIAVTFNGNGDAHVWFPTYDNMLHLIISSQIRKCATITFRHVWTDARHYICEPFDQTVMPVTRTPPKDMRADGKPISIVVDFIK